MKFTIQFRSPTFTLSTLLCLFALMTPGVCQAADGGGAAAKQNPSINAITSLRDQIFGAFHSRTDVYGRNGLHRAVYQGRFDDVCKLLANPYFSDSHINARDCDGRTAFHDAAGWAGGIGMIRAMLASHRLSPDTTNAPGRYCPPALYAPLCLDGSPEIFEALLASDQTSHVTINRVDKYGNTLAHSTVSCFATDERVSALARVLVRCERVPAAILNARNHKGMTALHTVFLQRRSATIINALLNLSETDAQNDMPDPSSDQDAAELDADTTQQAPIREVDPNAQTTQRSSACTWLR